jgi:glycosyltransferase involved in cell wall biosynthesis
LPEPAPLVVVGRPYSAKYFDLLKRLASGILVTFITDADDEDLRVLYRRAWAVILPSVYRDCYGNVYLAPELMGLTLLEGMSCGTPAICSRVGGLPEFVQHGETGAVIEGLMDLRSWLARLAEDEELVIGLGQAAREAVVRQYGLGVVGRAMNEIYSALVAEGPVAA